MKQIFALSCDILSGDEADDVEACRQMGIECITALWGNRDAEIANATITIQEPSEIFVKI